MSPGVQNHMLWQLMPFFTLDWTDHFLYAFPLFSIFPHFLQKLETDQAQAILIAPNWSIQPWYPKLTRLLIQEPLLLPRHTSNVHLPFNQRKNHPLGKHLRLMACLLSGDPSKVEAFTSDSRDDSQLLANRDTKTA